MTNTILIDKLNNKKQLDRQEWIKLWEGSGEDTRRYASALAREITEAQFGKQVYMRGLIELSNYCKNDCRYCGIRRSNRFAERYRMDKEEILSCCGKAYATGFRTFVLQGGEDGYFTDGIMCDIVSTIRRECPDAAITLSLGERSYESYKRLYDCGAERYLLRHETAKCEHYQYLHPDEMSFQNRMRCLRDLKEIGYQTGCGMMIGSPGQTPESLAEDMLFIEDFRPHMIGIGPFIPAENTPFSDEAAGTLCDTLFAVSLCRIMLPEVLLPATTALGSICADGRKMGILSGANVLMPNLSPTGNRKNYALYRGKIGASDSPEDSKRRVDEMLMEIGYTSPIDRGDWKSKKN